MRKTFRDALGDLIEVYTEEGDVTLDEMIAELREAARELEEKDVE